ncbi:unnamed protein product (macronuclear) [Paramecium tetraurelia]|uniref:Uncharacterized protein n=1 Tax=Paramecium tetraurelia TaxID=5888 RepID=A0DUG2_PARTE|nr:uncharacterized protein GSPATT00020351001 [Paramecium tetraurelia]CAK86679.1 unnamed protein product [Paramecium tetraurelia]|eukprot:XP_001454076.1 hypothetical protein (macronuclear) [Paramecium tetraurelia strain d4-2]
MDQHKHQTEILENRGTIFEQYYNYSSMPYNKEKLFKKAEKRLIGLNTKM